MTEQRRTRLEALKGWAWNSRDEKWEIGFQSLAEYAAKNGGCLVPKSLKLMSDFQLGAWVNAQRAQKLKMTPDRLTRLTALPGWSWNALADIWDTKFNELKTYSETHGHCALPKQSDSSKENKLEGWVNSQKSNRHKNTPERSAQLESLLGWSWNLREDSWEEGFAHLKTYALEHKDCLAPAVFKLPNGYKLGQWINVQRTHKDGMSAERAARLEGLPGWTWNARLDQWEAGFTQLEAYATEHGHCLLSYSFKLSNGYRLGQWVGAQRRPKMEHSPERKLRLDALPGWSWNTLDDKWETGLKNLKEYAVVHGDCWVPNSFKSPNGYTLGSWVEKQRGRKSGLSPERLAKLESLPSWIWRTQKPLKN